MKKKHYNWLWLVLTFFLVLKTFYVSSYLYMSRKGYKEADRYGIKGFYYVFPEDDEEHRKHLFYYNLYRPLMEVDAAMGTGRRAARSAPFRGLSRD